MASSLHHQMEDNQSWEDLTEMLEDLREMPLDHPDVTRNMTLN